MKVIDLLNKIANGEEMPKYITYVDRLKNDYNTMMVCKENIIYQLDQLSIELNDEVEIIEDNKKIEKLTEIQNGDFLELPDTHDIMNKINQIIDVINEMKNEN